VRLWLPVLAFVALFAVIATALYKPADRAVHSALVGQPVPTFKTAPLLPDRPGVVSAGNGKPRLINVYASWCLPCIAEAPQLMRLKQAGVRIEGIAVRDTPEAMRQFLARNGDPYAAIGADKDGAVQLALGSSGVPETFIVDGRGRILDQHIGDIREDDVAGILAILGKAR
jgi:cytochrome c biogenesis protein CcmG/thiol:disulfide interchange protein DsbE